MEIELVLGLGSVIYSYPLDKKCHYSKLLLHSKDVSVASLIYLGETEVGNVNSWEACVLKAYL